MQERPNIADQELIAALMEGFGIAATALTFLPMGADPRASVYKVMANDRQQYFLKVRLGELHPPAYLVPRLLYQSGIKQVVAPLESNSGALHHPLLDKPYNLILYPFVNGQTGFAAQLTGKEWYRLGEILARIHSAALPQVQLGDIRREDFAIHPKLPPMLRQINELMEQVLAGSKQLDDPHRQALFAFWQEKNQEIEAIIARTIELGQQSRKKSKPLVACHADFHTFNVLVGESPGISERTLTIVDWDETLLAPVERDLMFVIGQSAGLIKVAGPNQASFLEGYVSQGGCTADEIDPTIIAFYRYEWVVQEIGEYGSLVFFDEEFGEETRADSLREFKKLFAPGDVIEGAYRSDIV